MTSSIAVQGTNDSSICSKLSMVNAGYFSDPYLKFFAQKSPRRAPIINRGYFVRVKAIDFLLSTFLDHFAQQQVQFISLGAGFDTAYFRHRAQSGLHDCSWFEVDFPVLVEQKLDIIKSQPTLVEIIKNSGNMSTSYHLIGCDIRDLDALQKKLEADLINYSIPTLIVAECVLTYIDIESVNQLLQWVARSFKSSLFCTYEQVHPNDAFGYIMLKHFKTQGCALQNIVSYPTRLSQEERYKKLGWSCVISCDMNHFYSTLPSEEQYRVGQLEPFDEYEEWHSKCHHYMLLFAMTGSCHALSAQLPHQTYTDSLPASCVEVCPDRVVEGMAFLRRFGHSSAQLSDGRIIVTGGFGHSSDSTCHGRLDTTLQLFPCAEGLWSCKTVPTTGTNPGGLMHHTMTPLDGGRMLLYGGRLSPAKANGRCYVLTLDGDGGCWTEIHTEAAPEARWRHTTSRMTSIDGYFMVLVVGGRSESKPALDDCYVLDTKLWTFQKLDTVLPEAIHSHCAFEYGRSVVIIGGLNSRLEAVSSCLKVFLRDGRWVADTVLFEIPLPASYGMSPTVVGDMVYLVGGVQPNRPTQDCTTILMVDLSHNLWVECSPKFKGLPALLHGHTCHNVGGRIVILGGGGNCFSFGTFINSGVHSFSI